MQRFSCQTGQQVNKQLLYEATPDLYRIAFDNDPVFTGCKKNKETATGETHKLVLAANSTFHNDDVEIYIDGQSVYHQRVTTSTVGFAGSTQLDEGHGNHSIKVVINGNLSKSSTFTMTAKKYIGINYDQANEILIILRDEPFVYD
ncbi:hypothetical protein [Paraflavitalea speifideaquila]|uniref:hypothetical protein n=1 Tax=Paraflavitalea speifideaquila TaxID=3076558 RepID=UPI0028F0E260|nr:hypothetical protein [Paraflavitalea speifideiaquila]